LLSAYSVDGVDYAGTHLFSFAVGSYHTIAGFATANTQNFQPYTFSRWSVGGPMVQSYHAVGNASMAAIYGQPPACGGGNNPLTEFFNGCYFPASVDALAGPIGRAPWLGFVLLAVNVAIYNKTVSIWITLTVLWIAGAIFVLAVPVYVGQIAEVFLALGSAGIVVRLVLLVRG
jgi:hypothetical protein